MLRTARNDRRRAPATTRKDDIIQIRVSAETKAILTRAATLRGQKLSEFILDSARRQAEETILDQRSFFLAPEAYAKLLAMLDAPVMPTKVLRARMRRTPSCDH